MDVSICIVSKNRKAALQKTLTIIKSCVNLKKHEVFIFLDGCDDGSNELLNEFTDFHWIESSRSIGASPARSALFAQATGKYIIGFDDDAHPLKADFIEKTIQLFKENPTVAVLAFEEIKGIFANDYEAFELHIEDNTFKCNSFVGCGFAIRRFVYEKTAGFPQWMDIYGEEGCLSAQIIDKDYDILYTSEISVNHRVNRQERKLSGSNSYRFQKQLCHMAQYFLVFYPSSLLLRKWSKLFWHNFKRYACRDFKYFWGFVKGSSCFVLNI